MSERGLRLFQDYVANRLDQSRDTTLQTEDHAALLIAEADAAGIPISEVTEEVGAIADALAVVQLNKERHANRT